MDEIINSISNREWAALIWLTLFIIASNVRKSIRSSFLGVLRSFLSPLIVIPLLLAACYAAGEIYLLNQIGWWTTDNLKSTALWLITFAFVAIFEVATINDHRIGLGKIARDIFTFTSIFVFVTELHSFSLLIEVIALPIITFIALAAAVARHKPEHALASKFLGNVLGFIGLSYFSFSLWMTTQKFSETATWANALEFIIPIALSIGFLPFLYAMRLYSAYNSAFTSISIFGLDEKLVPYARWLAITRIRGKIDILDRWKQSIQTSHPANKAELKHSLVALCALVEREKTPLMVDADQGWSPYLAIQFMNDYDIDTGHYRNNFDQEWSALSPIREIGNELIWKNTLAYYVDGTEQAATRLNLKLNVNNPKKAQNAEEFFIVCCIHLLQQAIGLDAVERFKMKIVRLEDFNTETLFGFVSLTHDEWIGGVNGGYSRKFEISRGLSSIETTL